MPLEDCEQTEAWLRALAAKGRSKKFEDSGEKNEITDLFLSEAGMDAIRQVTVMAAPRVLEEMAFNDIREIILAKMRPKKRLVIAERTRFLATTQGSDEDVRHYVQRLRQAAKFCEFNLLNHTDNQQPAEDELIQMRLIDGLSSTSHRMKLLEYVQAATSPPSLDNCLQFAQQLELIQTFDSTRLSTARPDMSVAHVDRRKPVDKPCGFCGRSHARGRCPAFGKTCAKCSHKNHFAVVCRSTKAAHKVSAESTERTPQLDREEDDYMVYNVGCKKQATLRKIKVNGQLVSVQLDSGSEASIIPKNLWQDLGKPRLHPTTVRLKQFDGTQIKTLGQFEALIELERQYTIGNVVVAECVKEHGLLGTDILKVDFSNLSINQINKDCNAYSIGCLQNFQARIVLKEGSQPAYFEARPLPIHVRPMVIKKLNDMVDQGILEKVPPGGSRWASPLVIVRKPDGDVRICADYKVSVNPKICNDSFPMPQIESAFSALAGMSYFAKLDMASAYNQLELEKTSREITTINTPIGLLRWTRLPFGIKTASAQFQSAMEKTVGELPNMIIYQDDMCIGARNESELDDRVKNVLTRLKEAGMTINTSKSVLKATEISFLGHCISRHGVKPDRRLVEKVLAVKTPGCKKDLDCFVGLVNYFGRYIKNFSELTEPLNMLRHKDVPFVWGVPQQNAFESLKNALCEYPVVRPFDANKDSTLTTDASEKSISAVLTQEGHPVMYLSRRLSETERNYSNIEREALAIVWATNRARHYLMGKKFQLRSDHRPLEFMFNPQRELPKVTSARLMRWAIQLSAFDYDIQYVKGESIPHADALSRLDFADDQTDGVDACGDTSFVHWTETDVVSIKELQQETKRDALLSSVATRVVQNRWSGCSAAERPFKAVRQSLSCEDGILCKGDLLVPPSTLRNRVLKAMHDDVHCGATATRNRVKLEAWWPGYCDEVERYVKRCAVCCRLKPGAQNHTHTWPREQEPWSRVHMDHGHVPGVGLLLILVDAFSGWPEAVPVADRRAETVKRVLRSIFSRNGVPRVLVSDNAAEFADQDLCGWLLRIGCRPVKTPPYHPQSNGLAERMVQTVKRGLKAFTGNGSTFVSYLSRLLLSYRSVPHAGRPQSPSALMGRQLRSPMTTVFSTDECLWYERPGQPPEEARFIVQNGSNTATVVHGERNVPALAHLDQLKRRVEEPEERGAEELAESGASAGAGEARPGGVVKIRLSEPGPPRRSSRCNKGVPPDRFGSVGEM